MTIRYPDISQYQSTMDYRALAAQFPIVVHRCWRGNVNAVDTQWDRAMREIPREKLMAYHYIGQNYNADYQAQMCVNHLKGDLSIPIMLDWEEGGGGIAVLQQVKAAFNRLGANTEPLYVPRWYWQKMGRPNLNGLGLLINSHYHDPNNPNAWLPFGLSPVFALQYTDREQVQGRGIDMNIFRGDLTTFKRALHIGRSSSPPVPHKSKSVAQQQLLLN